MPYRAALTYFKEVTEAGVKVYLYDGGYYHAKTINVDGALCTIGSCNMDIRSYDLEEHMKLPFRRRFADSFCGWPRR